MFKIPFLLHGMALPELVLQVVHIVYLVALPGARQYCQPFQNHSGVKILIGLLLLLNQQRIVNFIEWQSRKRAV